MCQSSVQLSPWQPVVIVTRATHHLGVLIFIILPSTKAFPSANISQFFVSFATRRREAGVDAYLLVCM